MCDSNGTRCVGIGLASSEVVPRNIADRRHPEDSFHETALVNAADRHFTTPRREFEFPWAEEQAQPRERFPDQGPRAKVAAVGSRSTHRGAGVEGECPLIGGRESAARESRPGKG